MHTQNPFLDEMAKLTSAAMGLAQAAGEEAKSAVRAQTDKLVADLDLVRRDEMDALKAEIAALRAEVEMLRKASAAPSTAAAAASAAPQSGDEAPKPKKPRSPGAK